MTIFVRKNLFNVFVFNFIFSNLWKAYLSKNKVSDARFLPFLTFNFQIKEFNLKNFIERWLELELSVLGFQIFFQAMIYKKCLIGNCEKDSPVLEVFVENDK